MWFNEWHIAESIFVVYSVLIVESAELAVASRSFRGRSTFFSVLFEPPSAAFDPTAEAPPPADTGALGGRGLYIGVTIGCLVLLTAIDVALMVGCLQRRAARCRCNGQF